MTHDLFYLYYFLVHENINYIEDSIFSYSYFPSINHISIFMILTQNLTQTPVLSDCCNWYFPNFISTWSSKQADFRSMIIKTLSSVTTCVEQHLLKIPNWLNIAYYWLNHCYQWQYIGFHILSLRQVYTFADPNLYFLHKLLLPDLSELL